MGAGLRPTPRTAPASAVRAPPKQAAQPSPARLSRTMAMNWQAGWLIRPSLPAAWIDGLAQPGLPGGLHLAPGPQATGQRIQRQPAATQQHLHRQNRDPRQAQVGNPVTGVGSSRALARHGGWLVTGVGIEPRPDHFWRGRSCHDVDDRGHGNQPDHSDGGNPWRQPKHQQHQQHRQRRVGQSHRLHAQTQARRQTGRIIADGRQRARRKLGERPATGRIPPRPGRSTDRCRRSCLPPRSGNTAQHRREGQPRQRRKRRQAPRRRHRLPMRQVRQSQQSGQGPSRP